MSKKRIKIMIQGPNRRTYFRKGPIALHVSNNQELKNYERENNKFSLDRATEESDNGKGLRT